MRGDARTLAAHIQIRNTLRVHLRVIPHRKFWLSLSGALVLGSVVLILSPGPRFGIEFTGGTLWELRVGSDVSKESLVRVLRSSPSAAAMGDPWVTSTTEESFILRFAEIDNATHLAVLADLETALADVTEVRYTTIGPTVGSTLRKRAVLACLLAIVGMVAYITFAFRAIPRKLSPFRWGVVAILALLHDIVITIGFFTVLSRFTSFEVDTLFLSALLTVFGYSVNDTIVIFDRIRENVQNQERGTEFAEVADRSIDQTLTRSLSTGVTTLLMLTSLVLFGGATIRWFVLAIIVGIVSGTYSSLFVAAPLLVVWRKAR